MKKDIIKDLILLLIIFVVVLSIIIAKPLGDLDEIWNYNFARNVANGLIPYKDFNMVTMPLLPLICGLILKVITNELFIMRIIAAIFCSLIIYLIYKIFKLLKINNKLIIIIISFIGYLYHDILCIDYNWTSLLLLLVVIYSEIKQYKENNKILVANLKNDIFLGILAGLTFLLKQTSGLLICIAVLGNKLINIKNKDDFKIYIKSFIYRVIGILIPTSLMFIYLILNNDFSDFISYTIKGASSFTNYISYISLIKFDFTGALAVLVPIIIIYELYNIILKDSNKQLYYLFVYGLAIFIIGFPISNKIHFIIGATPFIILLIIEINNSIELAYRKFIKNKKVLKNTLLVFLSYINLILILTIIIYAFMNYAIYVKSNYSKLNHYKYIPIQKELENSIDKIDEYILENNKKVLILDAQAAVYMIPIDIYNKDYDMFNKGNFGYNGEERLINEISNSKDVEYLILNQKYRLNWQTPINIINYIKKNKLKKGSIEIFDIYE